MNFPDYMIHQRRWMVRPANRKLMSKLPQAAFETMPLGFDGDATKWRHSWSNPTIWATFDEAVMYWGENSDDIAGLSYVLHPAGDSAESKRLICFDFDDCFYQDQLDPDVSTFLNDVGPTYVERSLSGSGLHVFVFAECEPFRNILRYPYGRSTLDILCSNPVAVTGNVYDA